MVMYFGTPLRNIHMDGYDKPIFVVGEKKTFFHADLDHMIDIGNNDAFLIKMSNIHTVLPYPLSTA